MKPIRWPTLATVLATALMGAGGAAAQTLPPATWQAAGQRFVVELAADPAPGTKRQAALQHYAIGVVALPVSVVQPQVAVALPFYLLLAAPWQAVFNARADRLAQVLAEAPLPEAVVQALREQWPGTAAAPLQVTLRLSAYGLGTRSGRALEAFDSAEDLCLVAEGRLEIVRDGGPPTLEDIAIGPGSTTRDAPPPLCESFGRWAENDGQRLRLARRELAELLAAFIVDRAGARP